MDYCIHGWPWNKPITIPGVEPQFCCASRKQPEDTMNQPKAQPTKPSAGTEEAARKIWRKQYPNLPSVDAAAVQQYARIIANETGVAELLEAAKAITTEYQSTMPYSEDNGDCEWCMEYADQPHKLTCAWVRLEQAIAKYERSE